MTSSRLIQRGLNATGGVCTVTVASWVGENGSSITARNASRSISSAASATARGSTTMATTMATTTTTAQTATRRAAIFSPFHTAATSRIASRSAADVVIGTRTTSSAVPICRVVPGKQQQLLHSAMHRQQQQRLFAANVTRDTMTTTTTTTSATTTTTTTRQAASSSASAKGSSQTAATTNSTDSFSFIQWYEEHLQKSPIKTKMVTGSVLWGVGDAVAQIVPHYASQGSANNNAGTKKSAFVYDWPRTGRAVFFGFAVHSPLSHLHFNLLEWMTVRAGVSGLAVPVFKAFMEQFVYWSWISNSLYHGAMGAMQGMAPNQIYDRIADVLWETQKAQWAFWIPVQLLNFQFVPVRHQLNVVLVTSIVWTALLSAWYPPVEDSKEDNANATNEDTPARSSRGTDMEKKQ